MKIGNYRFLISLVLASLTWLSPARAQVNVTMFHNDLSGTGQNTQETILTPANVNSAQFGKLFSVPVDGALYAQPLYLSNVNIGGGTHNVVYVATEHDSVYAIDAVNGTIYAQVSLIPSGGTTVNSSTDLSCTDLVPEIGITGTPVIDPTAGILYVVAKSKVNGSIVQYLHALDVTNLTERLNGPVLIQGSVPGNGSDSVGGVVTFNSKMENQRPALLLENGHVIIGWASHCDLNPWHGWIMSYSAGTLTQEGVFNTSPNGYDNGVWMSGAAPVADANGNIYFTTGNGPWDGTADYGDSIVKLGPPSNGTFPVVDYFTPYNQLALQNGDTDLSAGGVALLPPSPNGQVLLAAQGKAGTIYLVDSGNLRKYCVQLTPACTNSDTNVVEEIVGATPGIWGSPTYWNGNLYWTGANDHIKAFSFNPNAAVPIGTTPTSQSTQTFAFTAPTPVISSNGTSNGILWALDGSAYDSTCDGGGSHCLGLYAYDATNLGTMLYNSQQALNGRDAPGTAVKFEKPIVANGMVYVGTQAALTAFGLLSAAPPVAVQPNASPTPGVYNGNVPVTLASTTPGAVIHYTTDGVTTPTAASPVFTTALQISATTTIMAITVAPGYTNSPVTSATYTISAAGGTSPVSVSLTSSANVTAFGSPGTATSGGGIDGNGFVYSAALLGSSLTWSGATFTFGAANVADAASGVTIALPQGNYTAIKLLGTGVDNNQTNQVFVVKYTDGSTSSFTQSLSDWFTPQNYPGETVVLAMPGRLDPAGNTDARTFNLYGYSFAVNSAKTVASITLPSNKHVVVLAIDAVGTGGGSTPVAQQPGFSPMPGPYTGTVPVTLSATTPGAVIHYTTDGVTQPTTASPSFSGTLQISATTTIMAIAVAPGYTNSPVASATYTISSSQSTSPVNVSLATAANITAFGSTGTAVSGGGIDGSGNVYAASLLGSSLTWAGANFAFGAPNTADAAGGGTIAVPAGNYSAIALLGTGVDNNQPGQVFVVTYTDGTTTTFTQSMSDWFTPQNYPGETTVLAMPYRLNPAGGTDARTFNLYGYSFAVNSAKTVASITLPNNRHAVILAIDAIGSGGTTTPVATSPNFSAPAGVYTSAVPVTLSDTTPGAVIHYTTDGVTIPTAASPTFSSTLQISSTTTIMAIAVAPGYTNSAPVSATYTITPTQGGGATPASVSLSPVANVTAFGNPGVTVSGSGIDGNGYVYSAASLGTSLTWSGDTFAFGTPNANDAVSNITVTLPAGNYSSIKLLASGLDGNQVNQTFVVTYTDGTTARFTQSLSDWFTPQNYPGETTVLAMPNRINPVGGVDARTFNLYGYSFALNNAKTVASITLPANKHVVVLAIDVNP